MSNDDRADTAGRQYPKAEHESLKLFLPSVVRNIWIVKPSLPWGNGGWYNACGMAFQAHIKMHLLNIRGSFASDPAYCFFEYDYMTKVRLGLHNCREVIKVQDLTNSSQSVPYAVYGTEIPRIIPGSKFWRSFGLDLVAFVEQRGLPDFF